MHAASAAGAIGWDIRSRNEPAASDQVMRDVAPPADRLAALRTLGEDDTSLMLATSCTMSRRPRHRRAALLVALMMAAACAGDDGGAAGDRPRSDDRAASRSENAAWYYQDILATTDLATVSGAQLVIVNPQDEPEAAIRTIHEIGAEAYLYAQFYWAPDNRAYEGIDLSEHPDWAFCGDDGAPVVGRRTGGETQWLFIDANEAAVHSAVSDRLREIEQQGWDGVFFDRGWAATQTGVDVDGNQIWSATSTCTDEPLEQEATFADAYVGLVAEGHRAGLDVVLNTGTSPYDPEVALRPDPSDPACRANDWAQCPTLDDVFEHVDWMADEAIAHPQDDLWDRDFAANRENERHGDVIGLITSGTLGGNQNQTKENVYFQWARVKLFSFPLAVNTGDDGCPGAPADAVCNRFGFYPELSSIVFGAPIVDAPASETCDAGSAIRCMWSRAYEHGLVLVNVSPQPKPSGEVPLGVDGCRHVFDVAAGQPLADNACVDDVSIDMQPWSGRPLLYSEELW